MGTAELSEALSELDRVMARLAEAQAATAASNGALKLSMSACDQKMTRGELTRQDFDSHVKALDHYLNAAGSLLDVYASHAAVQGSLICQLTELAQAPRLLLMNRKRRR
ncbi:MAG: hypothetical protein WBL65_21745 [Bryobacteraceae bacterium]